MPAVLLTKLGFTPKIIFSLHMMMYGTIPLTLFERYIFNDWPLFHSVFIALCVNACLDFVAFTVRRDKELIKVLRDFVLTFIAIIMIMIVLGIYDNAQFKGDNISLKEIATSAAYTGLMGYIAGSSLFNIWRIFQTDKLKELLIKMDLWKFTKPKNNEKI